MYGIPTSVLVAGLAVGLATAQTQTHGQMVGEVTAAGAVVWTRASQPCLASVVYATDAAFSNPLETPIAIALAARDNTVRIPLPNLQADTKYYYRLRLSLTGTGGTLGPVGSFTTAPLPTTPAPVSFAFSGDAQNLAEYGIHVEIAAQQPAFYLSLGDFPYCDGSVTVADYWNVHQTRRDSASLHLMTQLVPVIATWDDHEVTNNWDAATDAGLVQHGIRAFRDWFPLADGPTTIWRRLRFGREVELFVLDTRSQRGQNADLPAPGKPLLGAQQLQWLQQGLQQSTATWKFVATSVPTFYGGTDSWDGYVHEREALLAFLRDQQVHNVVFLAADQHSAAIRELREGLLEVQAGPLAQFLGGGLRLREPEQRWHATVRNFGMVHVDPSTSPSSLRIVFHDASGAVLREHRTTAIDQAARLRWSCDVPEGGFHLVDGPHRTRDEGRSASRARLHPGDYRLLCRDLPHGSGGPASLELPIPAGADVRIAADYEDVPSPRTVLLSTGFDQPFGAPLGWQIVDLGSGGPSAWWVVDGALTQRSNLGGAGAPTWAGTLAVTGDPSWTDVTLTARYRSRDNDSCGVVFRYRDAANYYRVRLDAERQTAQLTRFVQGTATVLAERTTEPGFTVDHWQQLTIAAIGSALRVWRDGELLFDVQDGSHANGRIGCYTWADQLVAFDDLVVRSGDATGQRRPAQFTTDFTAPVLAQFTIVDQGGTSAPSAWSQSGGVLRQSSNIGDGDGSRTGLPKLGTLALCGPTQADQELRVRVRSGDDDALGAVLRYQNPQNHYRVSFDAERHYRRLVKVVAGQWTVLWEDDDDYLPGVWHDLQFSAYGDRLRVVWNGRTLCDVQDASFAVGRAGLYCWASTPVEFDDLAITAPPRPRAITVGVATGSQDVLRLCAPESAGQLYLLALSASRLPGIAMAALQPGDPRTWELTDDGFFQLSLLPSPFLQQFFGTLDSQGRATATLVFPPFVTQLLAGFPLWAGGVAYDPNTMLFGELFPTVPVTIR
jgi:alkaline phosphatase D